jgi:hypothetical protein
VSHLEDLIAEFLDWEGYLVKRNVKVGRLKHGGWQSELDLIGYRHEDKKLVHYEPSIDAFSWTKREVRYVKKFQAGRQYIHTDVFPWLPKNTPIEQIAIFTAHPKNRHEIAGGKILSIDEFVKRIRDQVCSKGIMAKSAIPEQYPILRTIQLSHCGYHRAL